ncbi:hypothetical protein QP919_05805 [Corynebacterium propinquum]|uniref:PepSY domain-containing protein n=1 Tax=Corynebacterium propinquum TaxID=43769 RepID=A0AAP4F9Z0_9CORY|nr:hypothetical protein [Corynebacterium propinquum]MCG7231669.1 hypothetical protein [Corynebacterium propinquum]MCT1819227.1 hypothetical protein [Corynebacterium propinquum]MDK4234259.1 hypothetical protein [Corynebacterium propinquum]MDK4239853.1 hypothetical protein [Corynebacterium propinquum]MDK4258843.1 hypothetical protein [Corynebacterium propinquum]
MKSNNFRRVSIAAATAALGLTLAACSNGGSSAPVTVTETAAPADQSSQSNQNGGKETVTVTPGADANANGGNAGQAGQAGGNAATNDLPTEITGYSGEAERDLTEERLTKDEVAQVLQRAHNGEGKVKWDNDGYWEVEVGGVDIDIDQNGLVLNVDR